MTAINTTPMRLGISSYTYAWAIGVPGFPAPDRPMTAIDLVRRATSLGVRVLQIADNLPLHTVSRADQNIVFEEARAFGVQLELGTRGIDRELVHEYLQLALRAGARTVRTLIDDHTSRPTPDEAVRALRPIARECEKLGVSLAIENHDRFPAATLVEIVERVGSTHVGICLDTANSIGCLEGTQTVLDVLGPHTINLHIKDCCVARLPHEKGFIVEGCVAGDGQVDIPAVITRIMAHGRCESAIVELWPSPEPRLDDTVAKEHAWASDSVAYMRQLLTT